MYFLIVGGMYPLFSYTHQAHCQELHSVSQNVNNFSKSPLLATSRQSPYMGSKWNTSKWFPFRHTELLATTEEKRYCVSVKVFTAMYKGTYSHQWFMEIFNTHMCLLCKYNTHNGIGPLWQDQRLLDLYTTVCEILKAHCTVIAYFTSSKHSRVGQGWNAVYLRELKLS